MSYLLNNLTNLGFYPNKLGKVQLPHHFKLFIYLVLSYAFPTNFYFVRYSVLLQCICYWHCEECHDTFHLFCCIYYVFLTILYYQITNKLQKIAPKPNLCLLMLEATLQFVVPKLVHCIFLLLNLLRFEVYLNLFSLVSLCCV